MASRPTGPAEILLFNTRNKSNTDLNRLIVLEVFIYIFLKYFFHLHVSFPHFSIFSLNNAMLTPLKPLEPTKEEEEEEEEEEKEEEGGGGGGRGGGGGKEKKNKKKEEEEEEEEEAEEEEKKKKKKKSKKE